MSATAVALFVAALLAAALGSGAWCAIAALRSTRSSADPSAAGRRDPRRDAWPAVLLIGAATVLGGGLRYGLLPPHHAMYLDEPWYAEAACSLARSGAARLCTAAWDGPACVPYEKALGWPVALAPGALLAGCASGIGIGFNRLLGTASVLLVALAARAAGARWWQAALAAALLAIHPTHVAWSATGETNVPAAAALLAGVCGALRFLRRGDAASAALAIAAVGLAIAMRPESLVAALVIATAVGCGAAAPRHRRERVAVAIALVAALAAATTVPLWQMNAALSGGAFLSPSRVATGLAGIAGGPTLRVHAPLLAAALVGSAMLGRRDRAAAAMLLGSGIAVGAVVLAYDRFDERMLLAATVLLLPLAAAAVDRAATRAGWAAAGVIGAVALMAWCWLPALRAVAAVPETQLLERQLTEAAASHAIEPSALIVAPQPAVLAANGTAPPMPLASALAGLDRLDAAVASGRPVYFLCDMFCERGFAGGDAAGCDAVLTRFSAVPVLEASLPGRTYGIYRLAPPAAGATRPPCPRPHP